MAPRLRIAVFVALTLALAGVGGAHAGERWELAPGTSRTLKQAQGPASIELPARAGDTLFGEMDPIQRNGADDDPELKVRELRTGAVVGKDSARLVFRVPRDGVYAVESDAIARLTLWRLAPDDPRVDPGLEPDDVRIDVAALGLTLNRAAVGADPIYLGHPPPSGWPAHVELYSGDAGDEGDSLHYGDGRFWLGVFPAEGIRRLYATTPEHPDFSDALAPLEALLRDTKPIAPSADLPFFPDPEAEIFFAAAAQRMTVGCFAAVRYVARMFQEDDAPYPILTYVVQGLSKDRRLYLSVAAEIKPPELPGFAARTDDLPAPELARYKTALARALADHPERFTPTVAQLDKTMQGLRAPCAR